LFRSISYRFDFQLKKICKVEDGSLSKKRVSLRIFVFQWSVVSKQWSVGTKRNKKLHYELPFTFNIQHSNFCAISFAFFAPLRENKFTFYFYLYLRYSQEIVRNSMVKVYENQIVKNVFFVSRIGLCKYLKINKKIWACQEHKILNPIHHSQNNRYFALLN
jgi:hypothetical protein